MKFKFSKKFLALVLAGSFAICGTKAGEVERNENVIEDVNYDDNKLTNSKENVVLESNIKKKGKTKDDLVIETQKYVTATDTVNIRKFPSEESEKVGLLSIGNSLVMKKDAVDGWYQVEYDDDIAYVSASYVKKENKSKVLNDVKKIVYFPQNSSMYEDKKFEKSIVDIKVYQTANVYFENKNNYVASIDGNVGYIRKNDVSELEGIYVVVDLSDQELNLYQDKNILLTTPVVTGKPTTPTYEGLFDIFDITTNRYLVNRITGYKSYVNVMMAFDGNIGLHDAEYYDDYDSNGNLIMHHGWRDISEFGGDTHLYNGSHGCVNMPHDAAIAVYEKVAIGTKVLVKE